jgi:hypothetical protein
MTNNGEHDASPLINFPISTLFWEDDLCVAFRVKSNRPCEFQKRNQFFIYAHKETRSIAMRVNNPDRSPVLRDPHLNPLPSQGETDVKAPVRVEFRIHGMSLIPSIIETRSAPGLTRSYPRRFAFYVARPARSIPKFTEPEKTFLCMDPL